MWPRTTSRIVDSLKPWHLSDWNASSRFGPIVPCVPASARTWQAPHVFLKSALPFVGLPSVALRCGTAPQPAARSAAATTRVETAARRGLGRGLGFEGRDGLGTGLVDREDPVEPGDLEDLRDVPVVAHERQLAVVRPQTLDASDEHPQRRRVDEGRVREVHDDLP